MTRTVAFSIPGKPVPSRRRTAVNWKAKKIWSRKTPETENFHALVRAKAQDAMAGHPPFTKPVKLEFTVYWPIPKHTSRIRTSQAMSGARRPATRPDLENFIKTVADALSGVVYLDDSQIVDLHVQKFYADFPKLDIEVSELSIEAL